MNPPVIDLTKIKTKAAEAQKAATVASTPSDLPSQPAPDLASPVAGGPSIVPQVQLPTADEPEKEFQCYKSTIDNQRIAMPNGKIIFITKGQHITDDPSVIEFLDKEIAAGFPYLKRGVAVMSSDLDPMTALRKKHFAEFQAELAAGTKAAVPAPVIGNSSTATLSPASTAALAALSAGSDSPAS